MRVHSKYELKSLMTEPLKKLEVKVDYNGITRFDSLMYVCSICTQMKDIISTPYI